MIVLDTHVVLWLAQVPELLSEAAIEAIESARKEDGLAIADKSLWELAMMISRGQVGVRTSLRDFLQEVEHYLKVIPISSAIAERSMRFKQHYPKDPTDRLIGATALVHGFKLVTKDEKIRKSGEVPCIW